MVSGCSVPKCKNTNNTKKIGIHKKPISFFKFPTDPNVKKMWMKVCQISKIGNRFRVCSEHFDESCFERDLKSELLKLPAKQRLCHDAIPVLKLESSNSNNDAEVNEQEIIVLEQHESQQEGDLMIPMEPNAQMEAQFSYNGLLVEFNNLQEKLKAIEDDLSTCKTELFEQRKRLEESERTNRVLEQLVETLQQMNEDDF